MINWRTQVLGFLSSWTNRVVFPLLLLSVIGSAQLAKSQTRTSNYPGPAIREGNRAMDDYDRAINRMKNDARAVNERRQNLFPQINEDFQQIQIIHNEIVRMLKPDKSLDYERLMDLTGDMKKRSVRLRENLALPESDQSVAQPTNDAPVDVEDNLMKKSIGELHDLIVSFVANPIFKNLGVVDANVIYAARVNLDNIISMSDQIKREAKALSKAANK
ncbi:MAG TPA: hypothetical protein VIR01_21935 [Pyrinomonadaceae bacterium]